MPSPILKGKQKNYFEYFKDDDGNPPGKSEEVRFNKCKHKNPFFDKGVLRCDCGAAWSGERLGELEKMLKGS